MTLEITAAYFKLYITLLILQRHSNDNNRSEYESAKKSVGCEHSVKNDTFPTSCYPRAYAPFPNGYYSEFC
jgi:hypothetical protein